MLEDNSWECDNCKTGGGHCYGATEKCSCGCRFYRAQQMIVNFIKNSELKKYKNQEKMVQELLLKASDQHFESNKELYSYVSSILNKMAEYSNLNTGESKTRNI